MPRKPRFTILGIPQYVIQRGDNQEPSFYQELVIGRDDFKEKIEQKPQRQARRENDGRPDIKEIFGQYIVRRKGRITEKNVEIFRLGYGGRDWQSIFDGVADDATVTDS